MFVPHATSIQQEYDDGRRGLTIVRDGQQPATDMQRIARGLYPIEDVSNPWRQALLSGDRNVARSARRWKAVYDAMENAQRGFDSNGGMMPEWMSRLMDSRVNQLNAYRNRILSIDPYATFDIPALRSTQ